jgi:hypothetical protein
MKRHIGALTFLVLLGLAPSAWAAMFAEGFEAYPAGSSVHGRGGWKGWDNVAAVGAPVSNRIAHSGTKSVEILGTSDLVHEFALAGDKWVITAWQYVPSGAKGATYFILLNQYRDGGPYDWSLQTEFDLTAGTVTPATGDIGSKARIAYDRWAQIRVVVDLAANTFEASYDGTRIAAGTWDNNAHGTLQAIDLFGNGASSVYYDDLQIDSASASGGGARLPRPAYDSGWITTPFGSPARLYTKILTHGLGGNTDDYVVDMQMKVSGIAGPNLSNQGLGTTFYYSFLTDRSVSVSAPYSAVDLVTSVRLRIWVHDSAVDTAAASTP